MKKHEEIAKQIQELKEQEKLEFYKHLGFEIGDTVYYTFRLEDGVIMQNDTIVDLGTMKSKDVKLSCGRTFPLKFIAKDKKAVVDKVLKHISLQELLCEGEIDKKEKYLEQLQKAKAYYEKLLQEER